MKTIIRRACLAVLVCGLVPAAAFASPCVPGSLASFIALGGSGCNIGTTQFFNFVSLPVLGGSIPDSPTLVNPLLTPGFRFNVNSDAGPGSILERRIGYSMSGPSFIGSQVFLTGNNVTLDGAVTVVERLCLGAAFGVGSFCSATEPPSLVAYDLGLLGQSPSDSSTFPSRSSLGVIVDITVDGGTSGHAGLASATTQFTAVPESATLPFIAIGLVAGLAGLRVRRLKNHQV